MEFWEKFKKKKQGNLKNRKKELKRQELFFRVCQLLSKEFKLENKEKINPASRLKEDLGLDSVDAIQLVMALEDEFDFEIPDEDIEKIQSVEQIVDYLLEKLK